MEVGRVFILLFTPVFYVIGEGIVVIIAVVLEVLVMVEVWVIGSGFVGSFVEVLVMVEVWAIGSGFVGSFVGGCDYFRGIVECGGGGLVGSGFVGSLDGCGLADLAVIIILANVRSHLELDPE